MSESRNESQSLRDTTREAVIQAQKLEALGALTSGVAHDFNNLLTIVGGNLELIEGRLAGNSDLREFISRATDAIFQGASLTHQLLAFARRQKLEPENISISRLLREMRDLIDTTAGQMVVVRLAIDGEDATVVADPQQLKSAIINLVINARDAMPDGGEIEVVAVTKTLHKDGERATAGDYAGVSVRDNGHGMTADVRERAFEPFFTTKPPNEGSGLGLSTVFGFVQQSGGFIELTTAEDRGTSIALFLPLGSTDALSNEPSPLPDLEQHSGTETLLVVEDNNALRETTCRYLQDLGYEVLEAVDSTTAISIFDCTRGIDLVFTDIVMPNNGGKKVIEHIEAECPATKILCTSGNPSHLSAFDGGQLALIRKPYRLQHVAEKIRQLLDEKAQEATWFQDCGKVDS